MDTMITSDADTASGTAVTAPPEQSTGPGPAAPETQQTEGGEGQPSTESGQSQEGSGRKRWSIQDEVKELRSQRRELREQLSSFGSVREELAALREELNRRNQPTTAKTPGKFWQDPEGTLDEKLDERLERLQNNMFERFEMTREQEVARQALRQEQVSATEFIRSQPGYDASDDEDLVEIIEGLPNRQYLSPQMVAEFAWLKLNQQRGVGDRTLQKRQAAGVQGQPPGVGYGKKVWNKTEFDQAVDLVDQKLRLKPNDPEMNKLFDELQLAHKEGRVK